MFTYDAKIMKEVQCRRVSETQQRDVECAALVRQWVTEVLPRKMDINEDRKLIQQTRH